MDKDERKDRIIESARELFARFGLKKTTMDEIAEKCGMGKASLYYYFQSKEDIFKSVIKKELELFKKRVEETLSKESSPQEKLRAFIVARFTRLKEISNYYSTLKDEYLEHYAFVEKERTEFTNWEIQTIQFILDEGIQKGIFETSDSKLTAVVITYALKGLEFPWSIEKDMIDIETAINLMLPVFFRGIEKHNNKQEG
ncbi:MAG: TetR/AcrR family transcriptional regulator [bacterium]